MFNLEGRSIGDAWYYATGDAVHMYFLTKPEGSDTGLDIGHAVSRDLVELGVSRTGPDARRAWVVGRQEPRHWERHPPRRQVLDGLHRPQDG